MPENNGKNLNWKNQKACRSELVSFMKIWKVYKWSIFRSDSSENKNGRKLSTFPVARIRRRGGLLIKCLLRNEETFKFKNFGTIGKPSIRATTLIFSHGNTFFPLVSPLACRGCISIQKCKYGPRTLVTCIPSIDSFICAQKAVELRELASVKAVHIEPN